MSTTFPMTIPHAPTGFVNQAALDAAFSIPINDLYALVSPLLNFGRIQYTQTTAGQALTNGSFTTITGYSASADIDTFGGSTFNPTTGMWTCPANGQYEVSAQVTATSGSARLLAAVQRNAVAILSVYMTGTSTTNATANMGPKEFTLVAGDVLNVTALVNAASIVTANTNGSGSFLRIKRVG